MFTNFQVACEAAQAKTNLDGCVVHIRVVVEAKAVSDGTDIEHHVIGYLLSDWHDDSVVATYQ